MIKKRLKSIDFNDPDSIIKLLNNKKTTIEDVLSKLQDLVEEYQNKKEDFYIEELKSQINKQHACVEDDEDVERLADKITHLVLKDTKQFVDLYIQKMSDNILDAINEQKVQKDPAHAFLLLLQTMEKAFEKPTDKE